MAFDAAICQNLKWWTRFHNDGSGPCKIWPVQNFANNYGLYKYQVANEGCVDIYKWKALCMYVHRGNQQDEGKCVALSFKQVSTLQVTTIR